MAQVFEIPLAGARPNLKPVDIPRKPMGTSTIAPVAPSVNESIVRMFHDCGQSVRKIANVYRNMRVTEGYVEDQIRAHYRATRARLQVNAHVWRAA